SRRPCDTEGTQTAPAPVPPQHPPAAKSARKAAHRPTTGSTHPAAHARAAEDPYAHARANPKSVAERRQLSPLTADMISLPRIVGSRSSVDELLAAVDVVGRTRHCRVHHEMDGD